MQHEPFRAGESGFAAWLLSAVLARLTSPTGLEQELEALGALDSEAADWSPLVEELDRVGWTMAVLSAMGEGSGELARHHPAGLRWLLSWQWGRGVAAPDLTATGGIDLAWRVAECAFMAGSAPRFEKCESGWRIHFAKGSPLEVPRDWVQD